MRNSSTGYTSLIRRLAAAAPFCLILLIVGGCASTEGQQGTEDPQADGQNAASENGDAGDELAANEMMNGNSNNSADEETVEGGANGNFAAADVGSNESNIEFSESVNNVVTDNVTSNSVNTAPVNNSGSAPVNNSLGMASPDAQVPLLNQTPAPINSVLNTGLEGQAEGSQAATVQSEQTTVNQQKETEVPQSLSGAPGTLNWVGYNYSKSEKQVQVQIVTDGTPTYRIFQEVNRGGQPELVVRYLNTKMRRKIRRDIDASEFRSPVAYIRMRHDPAFIHTDVVLTLRENVQPSISTKGSSIMLGFGLSEEWFAPKGEAKAVSTAEIMADDAGGLTGTSESENLPGELRKERAAYVADPGKDAFSGEAKIQSTPLVPKADSKNELMPSDSNDAPAEESQDLLQLDPGNFYEEHYSVLSVAQGNFQTDIPSNGGFDTNDLLEDVPPAQALPIADPATPSSGVDVEGVSSASAGPRPSSNKKVMRLDFRDAPVSQIIRMIANESNINFVIAPEAGVKRTSISLKNVPWDVALKVVLEANRMGMQEVSPGVVRVDFLKTFADDKEAEERAKQATEALIPTKVLVMPLNYAKAEDAVKIAKEMLPKPTDPTNIAQKRNYDRFKANADVRSNSVIVEATPNVLSTIKTLMERLDSQTPQVRIASRLVEISSAIANGLGFTWGTPFSFDPGRGLGFGSLPFPNYITSQFSVDTGLPGSPGRGGSAAIRLGSINNVLALDMRLKMYEQQRLAETIQTQDVVVQDNETATVTAGRSDFVEVEGGQNSAGALVEVAYNLSLNVRPHITADGAVQMKLEIKGDSPIENTTTQQVSKNTRNLTTTLLKQSGETAVIGGLYDSNTSKTVNGVPFLSSIPLIGALFRTTETINSKKDLLIMVTPTIVGNNSASSAGSAGIDIPSPGLSASAPSSNGFEDNSNQVAPPANNSSNEAPPAGNGAENSDNANAMPTNFSNESSEL